MPPAQSNQPAGTPKPAAGATPQPAAPEARPSTLVDAMALIPTGLFVLTSSYCETRGGVIVRWVQTVSSTPPLVVVAIEKGQHLSPVIRDSRRFGLCQLAPEDRVLRRLFEPAPEASEGNRGVRTETVDPFLGLPTKTTAHGIPILLKAQA